jgi:hypothetical protein
MFDRIPRRLIILALLILFLAYLPDIYDVLTRLVFGGQPWWPQTLTDIPFAPILARFWLVTYVNWQVARLVGLTLLAIGIIWALWQRTAELAAQGADKPITTSAVLLAEAAEIHGAHVVPDEHVRDADAEFHADYRKALATDQSLVADLEMNNGGPVSPAVYQWLNGLNQTALCLSGGGIRSASFGLGVLQALAAHPRSGGKGHAARPEDSLLSQFNYLSTVSGGGYIGSWFSAWVRRCGFPSVWRDLVRSPKHERDAAEQPTAIKWLRSHSNYLTPKLGLTSADTLTDIAIFLRNLVLNWLVLLPVLCAVLILMKLVALVVFIMADRAGAGDEWTVGSIALTGLALFILSLRFTLRHRPSGRGDKDRRVNEATFRKWALAPAVGAAAAFTLALALATAARLSEGKGGFHAIGAWLEHGRPAFLAAALAGAALYAISYVFTWLTSWPKALRISDFWRWTLSGAVYGLAAMIMLILFWRYDTQIQRLAFLFMGDDGTRAQAASNEHLLALIFIGVPILLVAQLAAEMVFVGLSSTQPHAEDDREWLGRAAGQVMLAGGGWLIVMYLAYIGSDIAFKIISNPGRSLVIGAVLYVIAAVASAVLGKSHRTPADPPEEGTGGRSAGRVLTMVAVVCGILLVVGVSALIDLFVLGHSITGYTGTDTGWVKPSVSDLIFLAEAFLVAVVIGVLTSKSININRFSMHALYRNRLVRAFLGASVVPGAERQPDPFTEFDSNDNIPMHMLRGIDPLVKDMSISMTRRFEVSEQTWRPFHIVNIALNVTSSSKHLEWQERKAAPFTVSPLHCGSSVKGFRDSRKYGGYSSKDEWESGISLGTAMAISGAAASPNQGYNSSPPVAFLMTLCNVRLGWWLGNPGVEGKSTYTADGPRNAVFPLFSEMLGMTDGEQKYVYLSDGGHFENLAIYEMVRRRCRLIVVSDAGCDPKFAFEDLGNAVRKVEIDLGVPIRFHGLEALKARRRGGADAGAGHPYYAIGEIDYPSADGGGEKGIILYIKPAYHGIETAAGVRSYAISNPNFPHDDTLNQWFGESQMESYRALGYEITDNVLTELLSNPNLKTPSLHGILDLLVSEPKTGMRTRNTKSVVIVS